jgi:peptidoglycan L-alanyl-D-glutamate endopeptidase CwlK
MPADMIVNRSDGAVLNLHDEKELEAFNSLNPIPRDRAWIQLYLLREWGFDPYLNEGRRSKERQAELFSEGKSKTLQSKHLTGDAWDICLYKHGWDAPHEFKRAIGRAARIAGCVWGGQWKSFGAEGDWAHSQFEAGKIVG